MRLDAQLRAGRMTLLDFAAIAPWLALGVAFAFELYEGLDLR